MFRDIRMGIRKSKGLLDNKVTKIKHLSDALSAR